MALLNNIGNISIKEKFGRVFVRGENGEYDLVDGVRFSNTCLRIFKEDSEDSTYTGQKYSFGIQGQQFKVPIPMGENIPPKLTNLDAAYKKEVEIAKQLRVINNDQETEEYQNRCKLILDSKISLFWMLSSPGHDILAQDFLLKIGPFLYIEDLMESLENGDEKISMKSKMKIKLPYKFMFQMGKPISNAIRAPESNEGKDALQDMIKNPFVVFKKIMNNDGDEASLIDELVDAADDKIGDLYSWMHFILGLMSYLRTEALRISKTNGCSPMAFLNYLADVLDTFGFEYSQEWHSLRNSLDDRDTTLLPTVVALRQETSAAMIFLECILLQNGINLSDDVRGCILFKLIVERFKEQLHKFNDVVSFSKEVLGKGNEWRNNAACVLHKAKDMAVDEAFAKLAGEANQALEQVERLSALLVNLWKGTKEEQNVLQFVTGVKHVIIGQMQWSALIERYHKDITMDCYID